MALKMSGGTGLLDAAALLKRVGIKQGDIVVEFGCGTSGHLVFPAAHLVGPSGRVYAVDILKSVLSAMASRRKMEGVDNVEVMWSDLERPGALKLADQSADLVVLLHIVGQVYGKETMLREAGRILKANGAVLVADWVMTATPLGPPLEKRLAPEAMRQLAVRAGWEVAEEFGAGKYHWAMILTKKK